MAFFEDWLICLHVNEIILIILILQDGKLRKRYDKMLSGKEMPTCMQSYHSEFCISSCIYTLAHLYTKQFAEVRRCVHVCV